MVDADAALGTRVAITSYSDHALHKVGGGASLGLVFERVGLPSELVGVYFELRGVREVVGELGEGGVLFRGDLYRLEGEMIDGGADPVEPGPEVGGPLLGEGGARQLLGVETIWAALGVVASSWQGPS